MNFRRLLLDSSFFFLKMVLPVMLESVVFQDVVERLYPCVILMSLLFFPSLNFGCQIPPPCRVNPCPNSPHKLGGPVMHFRLNFQSTSVPKQSHLKRVLGESNATVCVTFYAVMRDTNRWDCGPINVRKPFCAVKVLWRHFQGYASHDCKILSSSAGRERFSHFMIRMSSFVERFVLHGVSPDFFPLFFIPDVCAEIPVIDWNYFFHVGNYNLYRR